MAKKKSTRRDKNGFTPIERMFVKEYLLDLNQTQAVIRAGAKPKSARVLASNMMKRPHVKAAVEEAMALRAQRLDVSADKVVQELARLGFAPIGGIVEQQVKKAALDSLGRHLGMFKDKIDMGVEQKTELRIKFV